MLVIKSITVTLNKTSRFPLQMLIVIFKRNRYTDNRFVVCFIISRSEKGYTCRTKGAAEIEVGFGSVRGRINRSVKEPPAYFVGGLPFANLESFPGAHYDDFLFEKLWCRWIMAARVKRLTWKSDLNPILVNRTEKLDIRGRMEQFVVQ